MLDYHVHTTIRDGVHSIEENVEYAIYKGFDEIGISEHWGIYAEDPSVYGENVNFGEDNEELKFKKISPFSLRGSLRQYFTYIDIAKEKYKDKILVKKGVEMDLYKCNLDYSYDFVRSFKPDYIIGSIHSFNEKGFHNCASFETVTKEFFKESLDANIGFVETGKMDILGHPLLFRRNEFDGEEDINPYYEKLALACKENNIVPEINMGLFCGNHKLAGDLYFLKCCGENNVPVIVNSDAHNKHNIGNMFPYAFGLLEQAGVKLTAIFNGGVGEVVEIDYEKAFSHKWYPSLNVIW